MCVVDPHIRQVRVELDGTPKGGLGTFPIPIGPGPDQGERVVGFGSRLVDLDSSFCSCSRFRSGLCGRCQVKLLTRGPDQRQSRVRRGVFRVLLERPFEVVLGGVQIRWGQLVEVRLALEIGLGVALPGAVIRKLREKCV